MLIYPYYFINNFMFQGSMKYQPDFFSRFNGIQNFWLQYYFITKSPGLRIQFFQWRGNLFIPLSYNEEDSLFSQLRRNISRLYRLQIVREKPYFCGHKTYHEVQTGFKICQMHFFTVYLSKI